METVRESEIGTATWEAFHFRWNSHAHTQSIRILAEMLRREPSSLLFGIFVLPYESCAVLTVLS